MGGASKMELDRAKLRIDSLQSAICYLQQQSAPKSTSDLSWLETPLISQPSKPAQRQKALQAEGKTAFSEMLKLVTEAKPVSLTGMPKNRLAWRPAAHTAKWHAQKKKEDWLTWQEWERDLLDRVKGRKIGKKINRPMKNDAVNDAGNAVVVVGEDEV
jgi:dynactin 1